jgi:transcriptional regulator with XRE-family HTH domain
MEINQRLKEARKALNMAQKDFAKALYVTNGFLSDVEKNRRKANDRLLKLASMVFGINEDWLKSGKGEMFHKSPDEKINRLVSIFNELPPDFQDFALLHLDRLLDLRKKQKN